MIHTFPFQIRHPRPNSKYNLVLCVFLYLYILVFKDVGSLLKAYVLVVPRPVRQVHLHVHFRGRISSACGAETTVSHSHVSARHCTPLPHPPPPTPTLITNSPPSPLFRRLSSCGEGRVLLSGSLWGVLTYYMKLLNVTHFLSSGLAFCARNMKHRQL